MITMFNIVLVPWFLIFIIFGVAFIGRLCILQLHTVGYFLPSCIGVSDRILGSGIVAIMNHIINQNSYRMDF